MTMSFTRSAEMRPLYCGLVPPERGETQSSFARFAAIGRSEKEARRSALTKRFLHTTLAPASSNDRVLKCSHPEISKNPQSIKLQRNATRLQISPDKDNISSFDYHTERETFA